ncbi:MAG TPA: PaaI family thioesterase [bacterium]|nr:PaaI family thioesterase [bacterium]
MKLIDTGKCIVCGKDNPHGFQLKISTDREKGRAWCTVTIPEKYIGWERFIHGGITSMLLDEMMAHAAIALGRFCVTAEMKVRFKRPVLPDVPLSVEGEVISRNDRIITTKAVMKDGDTVLAEAEGRMVIPRS